MTHRTPATGDTPSAPDPVFDAAFEPAQQIRRLLTPPADQRPDWLNKFLGDMTIPPISDTSTNPLRDVIIGNTLTLTPDGNSLELRTLRAEPPVPSPNT